MPTRHICLVLYPGCQNLDVSGPFEVFAGANRYLTAAGKKPFYTLTLASLLPDQIVVTESGLRIAADKDLRRVRGPIDTLLVPGGFASRNAERDAALLKQVNRLAARSARVAGVCTGAFVLAAAGLLDGRRATTHWAACKQLARRYPQISVDPDPIYVRDGNVYTSAGVTAGIDLALALVEADLGRDAALTIARYLVLFLRRPANQRQFSAQLRGQMAERDDLRRLQAYIGDHLSEDLSVERLATMAAMSPRNFARCFKTEVGMTPARYVTQLRIEAARRLLEEGSRPVERIAEECGFGTPASLRRTFLRELKTPPREYRRRFHSPANATQVH
jgi:transcriptional regulator GlxA family with amidase domain